MVIMCGLLCLESIADMEEEGEEADEDEEQLSSNCTTSF